MKDGGGLYPTIFLAKNRKGQFYLIAAIAIVGVLIGLAVVANSATKKSSVRVYDLRDELKIESEKVLDYGVYSETDLDVLTESFTDLYADRDEDLYFIYGTQSEIKIIAHSELTGTTIDVGDGEQEIVADGEPHSFTPIGTEIIISIDGSEHNFELTKGENFYFVIHTDFKGEEYVITN